MTVKELQVQKELTQSASLSERAITIKQVVTCTEWQTAWPVLQAMFPEQTLAEYSLFLKDRQKLTNYWQVHAYAGERLIACLGIHETETLYAGKQWFIDHFVVVPEARSTGVGATMLEWVEAAASEAQVLTLALDTYVENVASHRFYFRHGYHIRGYHMLKAMNKEAPRFKPLS